MTNKLQWKCNECDKILSSKRYLREHYTKIHNFDADKAKNITEEHKNINTIKEKIPIKKKCNNTEYDLKKLYQCGNCIYFTKSNEYKHMVRYDRSAKTKEDRDMICSKFIEAFKTFHMLDDGYLLPFIYDNTTQKYIIVERKNDVITFEPYAGNFAKKIFYMCTDYWIKVRVQNTVEELHNDLILNINDDIDRAKTAINILKRNIQEKITNIENNIAHPRDDDVWYLNNYRIDLEKKEKEYDMLIEKKQDIDKQAKLDHEKYLPNGSIYQGKGDCSIDYNTELMDKLCNLFQIKWNNWIKTLNR